MYRPKKKSKWPKLPEAAFPYIDKVRKHIPIKRYLTMPFSKQSYQVAEGWFYSKWENSVHGLWGHAAIDFKLDRNTDVLAAASGWAMSSYSRRPYFDKNRKPLLYKGKHIEMGLGYFVQIYHPEVQRYTLYAHLSKIIEKIPYSSARRLKNKKIVPANLKVFPKKMSKHFRFVWIERGEKIGEVSDSGICWGYDDFPTRPDPKKFPTWDEIHLHFEELSRDLEDGSRKAPRDPYDIYWLANKYPDSKRKNNIKYLGPKSIWKLKNNWPKFVT